jgi:hypothetical protein
VLPVDLAWLKELPALRERGQGGHGAERLAAGL